MENVRKAIICMCLCSLLFVGCQTTQRAVVPGIGDGVEQTRSNIADLGEGQTELALTGERIENQSTDIADGIEKLEQSIGNGATNDAELEAVLRTIRDRADSESE